MYAVRDWLDVELIGSTIDDAAGEAYDKVAAILGLGYPGGPIVDRLAAIGNPKAIRFPRTMLGKQSLDFSFSGLKTAVLYHVRGVPRRGEDIKAEAAKKEVTEPELHNIAAGFQAACIDVIFEKLKRAARKIRARSVIVGGGVSANQGLRSATRPLSAGGPVSADAILHGRCGHVRRPGSCAFAGRADQRIGLGCDHLQPIRSRQSKTTDDAIVNPRRILRRGR